MILPPPHFEKAFEMIKYMRGALYTILNSTEWMDDVTKQKALQKVSV